MRYLSLCLIISFSFISCKKENPSCPQYAATEIHTIPYGGSGTVTEGDYSGEGVITNVAGTTVSISGTVTVDGMGTQGKVKVPKGSTLIVNDVLNIGGGSSIEVNGTLITKTYTQVGNTCLKDGLIEVEGNYTIGGGTTLYIENSKVKTKELVIVGNIQCIKNTYTDTTNVYSLIEFTESNSFNRGGGTKVCGPILFTKDNDLGASGVSMSEVTNTVLVTKSDFYSLYGITTNPMLYLYQEDCTPLTTMPQH